MRSPTVFLATAAVAVTYAQAQTFLQCALLTAGTGILSGLTNQVSSIGSPANSPTGCPAACKANVPGSVYSFFFPIVGGLGSCYCGGAASSPGAGSVSIGTSSTGGCPVGEFDVEYLPATPFTFTGCFSSATITPGTSTSITDDASCFTSCAAGGYKYMALTSAFNSNNYQCQCSNTVTPGPAQTCQVGSVQLYTSSTASGAARRRRNLLAAQEAARTRTLCPPFQTACTIPDSEHNYECVDTRYELESCGGCVTPIFGAQTGIAPARIGTDCTSLPGVAFGGVSCIQGRCHIGRCEPGYQLLRGSCVPALYFNGMKRQE
ncbi:uncharacterized protein LOC62_01G000386 [Vanrija pseudolonga]|uniref:Protein CPL1-like domain-containing protein n=1 Tax=Vanrija pseudolonga TaxID=143232 RepID=A0AAF1BMJ1_9TREE|nr:hypothetical protein LOC62_01G000386 [Vanrija pseudolonga]